MPTMSTAEAAKRLGVKVQTIYAYVSRGILESQLGPDGSSSHFDVRAIETLALRGRPRQSTRTTSINMLIETGITSLSPHGLRYRGLLANELARSHTLEQVAELLWGGQLPTKTATWSGHPLTQLDGVATMGDRLRITTARLLAEFPALGRTPVDVAMSGRLLVATMVESLPRSSDGPIPRLTLPSGAAPLSVTIAARLWTRLAPRRPQRGMLSVLNAALVLMADHELATSTLAVRVAASTHASPIATVLAGLGALSGPLHGSASSQARALLARAGVIGAKRAIDEVLARGERLPGFGHKVYADADPRAVVLMDMLHGVNARSRALAIAHSVHEVARHRIGREPNIDFALAAFAEANDLAPDAGEAIMSIARVAGWLAHATEEYAEPPLRFRPRALYTGP